MSSSVPGQDTANTSNGQCTHQKLVQYITNTFRIFQANLIAVFPAQDFLKESTHDVPEWLSERKWSVHSQCTRSCDQDVPNGNTLGVIVCAVLTLLLLNSFILPSPTLTPFILYHFLFICLFPFLICFPLTHLCLLCLPPLRSLYL